MPHSIHDQAKTLETTSTSYPATAGVFPMDGTVPFDKTTAEQESLYHAYTGNTIPWFVRGIWISFWCFAIAYVIMWFIPSLQSELLAPP